jgi:ubiquinol-cytochrome c reductase cytochrome c subunit
MMSSRAPSVRRPHRGVGAAGAGRLFWLAPVLALVIAAGTFRDASGARAAPLGQAAAPSPDIRQIFLSDCAVCHGSSGEGTGRGPSLIGVGRASLDYQLSTGRMPLAGVGRVDDQPGAPLRPLPNTVAGDPDIVPRRHEPAYDPPTVAGLVAYVSTLTGGGGPDIPRLGGGNLADGGDLFRLQCAACHAWAGDGGALPRREVPALHASTETQVAEAVRIGPGQMPAFGVAALTDEQLASVAAYVRYLDRPRDLGGQPLWHLGPVTEGALALIALAGLLLFTRWIGERG